MRNWSARIALSLIFLTTQLHAQVDHWERLVDAHDLWSYRLGNSEPSAAWKSVSFNDATWSTGYGSIGYGTSDDSTIINTVSSIYMRKEFQVSQLSDIEALIFHADYDDAFVAYLNGVEIARENIDALVPAYNATPNISRNATTSYGAATWQGGRPGAWVIHDTVWQGLLQNGTNVLAVHTLDSANTWDLTTKYWLHVGMSSTNQVHAAPSPWFHFETFESKVGVMRINTYGKTIDQYERRQGVMEIVWDASGGLNPSYSGANDLSTNISIKKRGSGSLHIYPKNGYSIESKDANWEDTDISPMGLPEEEDWILNGPYSDRTFMRNVLAFHLARESGHYASRTRYVELFVNGEYEGIYVLMERIKRDKNRVNIAKLKPSETTGDDLTGGYIWRTDWGDADWNSNYYQYGINDSLPYQYVVPKREDIVSEQEAYIQDVVDDFETALNNTSMPYKGKYWHEYINVNAFVDYLLVQELTKNIDAYRASSYYYKDKDSKDSRIQAGPAWDFNLALGLAISCDGFEEDEWLYKGQCSGNTPFWWNKLMQTPAFADEVNCRWKELTTTVWHHDTIMSFIGSVESLLNEAAERNHARWPITAAQMSQVKYMDSTFAGDVDLLRDFITARMSWLDSNMVGTDCQLDVAAVKERNWAIYPNPSTGIFNVEIPSGCTNIVVRNALGQQVLTIELQALGEDQLRLDLRHLSDGMYICELVAPHLRESQKLFIRH